LTSKSELQLQDAGTIVRDVGEFDVDVGDEAFGAVLLVGDRRSNRPAILVPPEVVEEGAVPEGLSDFNLTVPSSLLPDS